MASRAIADINTIQWRNLERVLNEFADYFIEEAQAKLGENGTNASYVLSDTMQKEIEISGNHYAVFVRLQDYYYWVENGRRPGKMPPIPKIKTWVEIKPVRPYTMRNGKLPTTQQLAFLIARKIGREGTQPQPFIKPTKQKAIKAFQQRIDEAIDTDVSEYVIGLVEQQLLYEQLFSKF